MPLVYGLWDVETDKLSKNLHYFELFSFSFDNLTSGLFKRRYDLSFLKSLDDLEVDHT